MAKKKKKKGLPIPPGRGNTTEELIDLLKQSKLKITVQPDTNRGFQMTQGPSWNVAEEQRRLRRNAKGRSPLRRRGM
tara:strand:+ start:285 stop:515 length:231 start_codon:yes stop_codon:yes gene_type:complete